MWTRIARGDGGTIAVGVIVCAIILFVSVNLLAQDLLRGARLDLTEDRLYTISEGTEEILARLDEPIRLRLYQSRELQELGPYYTNHAKRVRELLERYVELSAGRISIESYAPEPYSPEEDLALADGVNPLSVGSEGRPVYFGLAGHNSTDDLRAIPVLSPDRAPFLEYDLTRLVHDLGNPEKPVVGLIGSINLRGDRLSQGRPWQVLELMRQSVNVRTLGGRVTRIADDIDVLLLVQPDRLEEATLYAIDQFVMRGGRVLAFLDPLPETQLLAGPQAAGNAGAALETMERLLAAWGVEIPRDEVIGDRANASRVRVSRDGRDAVIDYPAWIGLRDSELQSDDVVIGAISRINLQSPGHVRLRDGAPVELEPLFTSSDDAAPIAVDALRYGPDPERIAAELAPTGERYWLAARLRGTVRSAFPDGPPDSVEDEEVRAAHRSEAEGPFHAVIVADTDMLTDVTWTQQQSLLGQTYTVPFAGNGDFAVNALEQLAGAQGLAGLRGRTLEDRPFRVIEEMRREAETRFRATEQELLARIEEAEARIRELQRGDVEGELMLTSEQQEAIDEFRRDVIGYRQELRAVRHALQQDVDRLERRITLLNVGAVPVLVVLLAIAMALLRRLRTARRHRLRDS